MKKLYYFISIAFFAAFFTGCSPSFNSIREFLKPDETDSIELKAGTFKEGLTIYGKVDPKLKVSLISTFEGTNTKEKCFSIGNGWSSFSQFKAVSSSYGKDKFKLSVPIEWESILGEDRCDYELYSVSLHIMAKPNRYVQPIDLLLSSDNESEYQILNRRYFNLARDFKVRHLTGISMINCTLRSKDGTQKLICNVDLNESNIVKRDSIPNQLAYGINILLSK